jgi:hypothetical protein
MKLIRDSLNYSKLLKVSFNSQDHSINFMKNLFEFRKRYGIANSEISKSN